MKSKCYISNLTTARTIDLEYIYAEDPEVQDPNLHVIIHIFLEKLNKILNRLVSQRNWTDALAE